MKILFIGQICGITRPGRVPEESVRRAMKMVNLIAKRWYGHVV